MKKGIALLMTVGFIVVLTALIAYIFTLSQSMFEKADDLQKIDQRAVLLQDVKKLLDRYTAEVTNTGDLSYFLSGTPSFFDSASGLGLDVRISPLSNKMNINSILINKKVNPNLVHLLQNICETYNILDSSFFISLILDTIDKDITERQSLSEISIYDPKYSNGAIHDMRQFRELEKYYARIVQDGNIFNVPWDRFIYFGANAKSTLDCDRINKEMVFAMGLDSENFTGCDDLNDTKGANIAAKYNLRKFSKENNYYILVKIFYKINSIKDEVSFIYDMKTKKVSDIELF